MLELTVHVHGKKKGESLRRHCTSKGKKEGVGGKMARFMVAIAYNRGVIKCHHYEGAINSEMCKSFVEELFSDMFEKSANPKGKLFLQDGDPSQNSKLSKDAMDEVGCRLFKIPPRSPDLNSHRKCISSNWETIEERCS